MVVEIEGVPLHLAHPDELSITWVGQEEVMRQLLAAWLVIDAQDLPMNPRLLGKPGVGKTTLAYAAAKRLDREVYIMQATIDTRPEDLLVTPVIEGEARLRYVASPLVTAMLRGGIAILDEGNRMSEKSWASLAPLLDTRRYVESIVAGIKIKAHPSVVAFDPALSLPITAGAQANYAAAPVAELPAHQQSRSPRGEQNAE